MSAQETLDEIMAHIQKSGHPISQWYAGVTSSVEQRLYGDHNVSKENSWCAHDTLPTHQDARDVERALLKAGCDGGPGGGDSTATTVYAYLKTAQTAP